MTNKKDTTELVINVTTDERELVGRLAASYGLDISAFVVLLTVNFANSIEWQDNLKIIKKTAHEKIMEGLKQADAKKQLKTIETLTFKK